MGQLLNKKKLFLTLKQVFAVDSIHSFFCVHNSLMKTVAFLSKVTY